MTREERLAFQALALMVAAGGVLMILFSVKVGGFGLFAGGLMLIVSIAALVWSANRVP